MHDDMVKCVNSKLRVSFAFTFSANILRFIKQNGLQLFSNHFHSNLL